MKNDEDSFKKKLGPEQYHILRESGTEIPFSGKYAGYNKKGMYSCAACGNKLFDSKTKFDSNCGWPSFYRAKKDAIEFRDDARHGLHRIEVRCKKCKRRLVAFFEQ